MQVYGNRIEAQQRIVLHDTQGYMLGYGLGFGLGFRLGYMLEYGLGYGLGCRLGLICRCRIRGV